MDDSNSGWMLFSNTDSTLKGEWINVLNSSIPRRTLPYDSTQECTHLYKHYLFQFCANDVYDAYFINLLDELFLNIGPSNTTYMGFKILSDNQALIMAKGPFNYLARYNLTNGFTPSVFPNILPSTESVTVQKVFSYDNLVYYYDTDKDILAYSVQNQNYRWLSSSAILNAFGHFSLNTNNGKLQHRDPVTNVVTNITTASTLVHDLFDPVIFWHGSDYSVNAFVKPTEIYTINLGKRDAYLAEQFGNVIVFSLRNTSSNSFNSHIYCIAQKKWSTPIRNVMEKSVSNDASLVGFRIGTAGNVIRSFDAQTCTDIRTDTISYPSNASSPSAGFQILGKRSSSILYMISSQNPLASSSTVYQCFYAATETTARNCSGVNDARFSQQNQIAIFKKNDDSSMYAMAPLRNTSFSTRKVPSAFMRFPNHLMTVYCNNGSIGTANSFDVFDDDTLSVYKSGTFSATCDNYKGFWNSQNQLMSVAIYSEGGIPVSLYDQSSGTIIDFDFSDLRILSDFQDIGKNTAKRFFKTIVHTEYTKLEALYQLCSKSSECNDDNYATIDKCVSNLCVHTPSCPLTLPFKCPADQTCVSNIKNCFPA